MTLLSVKNLSVEFQTSKGWVRALDDMNLTIERGQTVALVGESGSGKSISGLSIMQLLNYPQARHGAGSSITYTRGGKDFEIIGADDKVMRDVRGDDISMIFQEPMTALNPLHSIERQISESLILHQGLARLAARARALELLEQVGIANAKSRLDAYPHELSGGQRQRVVIAMALANRPELLIADEPTTALDVTVEAQILKLLQELQKELNMGILLITHDLSIVRSVTDETYVLEKGKLVERGGTRQLFASPKQPYTKKLIDSEPAGAPAPFPANAPVAASAKNLKVHFPIKQGILKRTVDYVRAVDGVDFTLQQGETLGIVGESGSGKSTLGYAMLKLVESQGDIQIDGVDIQTADANTIRALRRNAQIVFQDPFGALSPRMTIAQIIGEGLTVHRRDLDAQARDDLIVATMAEVGLDPMTRHRYPHEFSGGQRQRVSIARAMVLEPKLVVLDEPTSALDRTVQLQVIDLLRGLQEKRKLSYLFISHDLAVVRAMSHKIIVLRRGQVVEAGPTAEIIDSPRQPYTQALMAAAFNKAVTNEEIIEQ